MTDKERERDSLNRVYIPKEELLGMPHKRRKAVIAILRRDADNSRDEAKEQKYKYYKDEAKVRRDPKPVLKSGGPQASLPRGSRDPAAIKRLSKLMNINREIGRSYK